MDAYDTKGTNAGDVKGLCERPLKASDTPRAILRHMSTMLGLAIGLLAAAIGVRVGPDQGSDWRLVPILIIAVGLSIAASTLVDLVWRRHGKDRLDGANG